LDLKRHVQHLLVLLQCAPVDTAQNIIRGQKLGSLTDAVLELLCMAQQQMHRMFKLISLQNCEMAVMCSEAVISG
jgi:hypothetical protein